MNCRHCKSVLEHQFLDLGFAPPSNAYLTVLNVNAPELYFPLKLFVCNKCWLVQTQDYARADELFNADYAYFSSTSKSWLEHAAQYVDKMCTSFLLNNKSYVIEIASNDGYLLKNFIAAGVPCLGIEPTASTAAAAEAIGIPVIREFFGLDLAKKLAKEDKLADLILGNNVYAHVPNINDFTLGLAAVLKQNGIITLEFPHLLQIIKENQFDTVYHEHFSYFSLHTISLIFKHAGLRIWDVERLPTHGGSLRVYGCHAKSSHATTAAVEALLNEESNYGLQQLATYQSFQECANKVKNDFLAFLIEQKRMGKSVAAYGAAAKGNTLLNYAGVKPDLLPYVCDAAPSKQGKYMPGSHIPILAPEVLLEKKPDVVVIFPWNITQEVIEQNAIIYKWGGKFVTAIPSMRIFD